MDPFWFKVWLVVFLIIAQAILWIWVGLRRRRDIPGVTVFNWSILTDFLNQRNDDRRR